MYKYDYSMLRGKIREYYGTEKKFAEELRESKIRMSSGAFSSKINGLSHFKQPEIDVICKLLSIAPEEIAVYFFRQKYELNS